MLTHTLNLEHGAAGVAHWSVRASRSTRRGLTIGGILRRTHGLESATRVEREGEADEEATSEPVAPMSKKVCMKPVGHDAQVTPSRPSKPVSFTPPPVPRKAPAPSAKAGAGKPESSDDEEDEGEEDEDDIEDSE